MKRLLALLLAAMMLLSLAACAKDEKKSDGKEENKETVKLETFEMEVEPDGVEEPAKATIGYPENFTMTETDWCVQLTDEEKDVLIEVYMLNDYDCYAVNQEYAADEYYFYEEAKFGDFEGYVCLIDEASSALDVYVYLDCVEDIDDVYLSFSISSSSQDLDADPQDFYALEEVKAVLNSVSYTAPAK